jgi:hypothetical protein
LKIIIEILIDLTPEQQNAIVKFLDDSVTTKFIVHDAENNPINSERF